MANVLKVVAEMYSYSHGGKLEVKEFEDYEQLKEKTFNPPEKEDDRTCKEITQDIWNKIRGQ